MTAVEWLETQIVKFHNWKRNPIYDENCFDEIELNKAIQQAKELEKQQKGYSEEDVELIANEMVNWAIDNIGNQNPQSGKKFDEVITKFKKK